eukprot:TRINITY_DN104014_c0_g1_i1.p1 TRINITY_DN104014_c0_g1~~TRINITY_DN104014_c0_g1_i1.p1  ORF type:complete len:536 (-),score=134.18 TRINITY_DN104014_c0_g1_i1:234-1841(-)
MKLPSTCPSRNTLSRLLLVSWVATAKRLADDDKHEEVPALSRLHKGHQLLEEAGHAVENTQHQHAAPARRHEGLSVHEVEQHAEGQRHRREKQQESGESIAGRLEQKRLERKADRTNKTGSLKASQHSSLVKTKRANHSDSALEGHSALHGVRSHRRGQSRPVAGDGECPSDAELAESMKQAFNNPMTLVPVLSGTFFSLKDSIEAFTGDAPDIAEGIKGLADGLWESMKEILGEDFMQCEKGKTLDDAMEGAIEGLADIKAIKDGIQGFVDSGDDVQLIEAIELILKTLKNVLNASLPQESDKVILRYVMGTSSALTSIAKAITKIVNGEELEGGLTIYDGLKKLVDSLMLESIRNDEVYKTVMASLDGTVGQVTSAILEYRKKMRESDACWKTEVERPRYKYSFGQICPLPNEAVGWFECAQDCPEGYNVAPDRTKCQEPCPEQYGYQCTLNFCTDDVSTCTEEVFNMVFSPFKAALSLGTMIAKMVAQGRANAESITRCVEVVVDMGKAFAFAPCNKRIHADNTAPADDGDD